MTVSVLTSTAGPYLGNGSTTAFPFSFKAMAADEVQVTETADGVESIADPETYSVTLDPTEGGTVNYIAPPPTGTAVLIQSNPDFSQQTSFVNAGAFLPSVIDQALDRAAVRLLYVRDLALDTASQFEAFRVTFSDAAAQITDLADGVTADGAAQVALAAAQASLASTARVGAETARTGSEAVLAGIVTAISGVSLGSATINAATRTLLKGLDTSAGLPAYFDGSTWDLVAYSGVSSFVTADTTEALYARSTFDTSKVWKRRFNGQLSILWFGGVADDNGSAGTDNLAAANAALTMAGLLGVPSTSTISAGTIYFPPGRYYFSGPINIKATLRLLGESSGQAGRRPASWLRFPSGSAGIIVNTFTSLGYTDLGTPTTFGDSSVIERLGLQGGTLDTVGGGAAYNASAQADGILCRGRAVVRDCQVFGFQRHGYAVIAGSDGNPMLGNANNTIFERCAAYYNGYDGFHWEGTDANAGYALGCDAGFNRRWGFADRSFLGNALFACHAANNGIGNGTSDVDSVVAYPAAGQRYAVAEGMETLAATTTPGTNGAVWIPIPDITNGRTWTSGIVVRSGGPFYTSGGAYDCYSELGQGPSQGNGKVDGGLAAGFVYGQGAVWAVSTDPPGGIWKSPLNVHQTFSDGSSVEIHHGDQSQGDKRVRSFRSGQMDSEAFFVERVDAKDLYSFNYGTQPVFHIVGAAPAVGGLTSAGLNSPAVAQYMFGAHVLGVRNHADPNDFRRIFFGSAPPTTGDWARGDRTLNIAPAIGQPKSWACIASGAPGLWQSEGNL